MMQRQQLGPWQAGVLWDLPDLPDFTSGKSRSAPQWTQVIEAALHHRSSLNHWVQNLQMKCSWNVRTFLRSSFPFILDVSGFDVNFSQISQITNLPNMQPVGKSCNRGDFSDMKGLRPVYFTFSKQSRRYFLICKSEIHYPWEALWRNHYPAFWAILVSLWIHSDSLHSTENCTQSKITELLSVSVNCIAITKLKIKS